MKVRAQEAGRRLMKSTAEDDKGVLISGKFICRPVSMIANIRRMSRAKLSVRVAGTLMDPLREELNHHDSCEEPANVRPEGDAASLRSSINR